MNNFRDGWLPFITGLFLCLSAATLAVIDALTPGSGSLTLSITLLAGLFLMGLILAIRGLSHLRHKNKIQ